MIKSKAQSVMCEFWQEDGVWNGEAVDLPIAVFGNTYEEALENLNEGILSHLSVLEQIGNSRWQLLLVEEFKPSVKNIKVTVTD